MTEEEEKARPLAKACAAMVENYNDENKTDLSEDFVSIWNKAIKIVTPLEFFKMICDELTKGQ